MFSLLNLPTELTRCIIFALDDPPDLLHLALTCKFFYELIIPTHHLHLTNISCSNSETPLEFWEKLRVSRYYGSMIRQLEICDDFFSKDRLFHRRWSREQRIRKEFVSAWTGSSPRLPITPAASSRGLIQSMSAMEGLTTISIFKENSDDEYDGLLYHMSKNFSHSLKTLYIRYGHIRLPDGYVPRYEPSDCSFHHLTTCSLKFGFEGKVPEPFDLLLNSLASSCHTLVEFALSVSCQRFPCLHWVKQAHWPLLKKLTLRGPVRLVDADDTTLQEDLVDSVLSFFARHSKLECLYLSELGNDINDAMNQFLTQHKERLRDILPSIRSLHSDFSIPPEILSRLVHVSNLDLTPREFYPFAQSLRSCDLDLITLDTFEIIVENIPHLERVAMILAAPKGYEETNFECFWDGLPELLTRLESLTHLMLYIDTVKDEMCRVEDLAEYLPSLTYAHVQNNRSYCDSWWHITADPDNPGDRLITPATDSLGQSFRHDYWGDFFLGPV